MSNPHQFHGTALKGSRRSAQPPYQKKVAPPLPSSKAGRSNGEYYHVHNKPVTVYVKKKTKEEMSKEEAKMPDNDHKYYALPKEVCVFSHLNEESFPIPQLL
jgi:hypothetical protein